VEEEAKSGGSGGDKWRRWWCCGRATTRVDEALNNGILSIQLASQLSN